MEILRYTAFTNVPTGGNPAGVVLDADELTAGQMQEIAAVLGYAESAFISNAGAGTADIRYFAPAAEIPFCGHATIATAVVFAERFGPGRLALSSPVGPILTESHLEDGRVVASLTSVEPDVTELHDDLLQELLSALRLDAAQLDPELPPMLSFAGNVHPILPLATAADLNGLDYDFSALAALMAREGWPATVNLVHRMASDTFAARNPFPPGGVREDPATGSAAAALGAYLRFRGDPATPGRILVHQGDQVGRPSLITVDVPATGGITVSGPAVRLPDHPA
jgi:PhzF family phenazine biosynthesis protein